MSETGPVPPEPEEVDGDSLSANSSEEAIVRSPEPFLNATDIPSSQSAGNNSESDADQQHSDPTNVEDDFFAQLTGGEQLFVARTAPVDTFAELRNPPKEFFSSPGMRAIISGAIIVVAVTMLFASSLGLKDALAQIQNEQNEFVAESTAEQAADTESAPDPVALEAKTTPDPADDPSISEVEEFTATAADETWLAETAVQTGIPRIALSAYAAAELTVKEEYPQCHIGWNTIAAIGMVESQHGTLNGAKIGADGRVQPRIIGPALNGNGFAATPDTDNGIYDEDTVWDHAVGPMQFIPETWETYKRDADGDGIADIDNLHDAALSAATLLCEEGGDLATESGYISALRAYNPSVQYNNDVADQATVYGNLTRD